MLDSGPQDSDGMRTMRGAEFCNDLLESWTYNSSTTTASTAVMHQAHLCNSDRAAPPSSTALSCPTIAISPGSLIPEHSGQCRYLLMFTNRDSFTSEETTAIQPTAITYRQPGNSTAPSPCSLSSTGISCSSMAISQGSFSPLSSRGVIARSRGIPSNSRFS